MAHVLDKLTSVTRRGLALGCLLAGLIPLSCHRASRPVSKSELHHPSWRTLTDGLGLEVTFASSLERVVSLAPSNTEILFAIGAGPLVAACDDRSDYPPQVAGLPRIGSTDGKLNREKMVALEPDLVLAAEINSKEIVKSIEDLGLKVFLLKNPTTFEALYENMALLGQITGHATQAEHLVFSLKKRIEEVKERLKGVASRPRVFYELDCSDPTKPWTTGPGTFLDALITLAGGVNFAASSPQAYPRVALETILRQDPEIIILGDAMAGVTPDSLAHRAGWDQLSAVRGGRVYAFDDNLASRPGPRLVDGLESLARLLHPDAFRK